MTAKLTIDKAGRVVIPKPVRMRLGLKAGSKVKLTENAGTVTLQPVEQRPSIRRRGRFLVHVGTAPPSFDVVSAIDEMREERMHRILGRR